MKHRIIFITLVVLAIAGGGYGAYATRYQKTAVAPVVTSETKVTLTAKGIIKGINDFRAAKGLPTLEENALLDESSCLKANDMVAKNYWSHVSPDGLQPWYWFNQVGYKYAHAGENLAYGYYADEEVITGWENSKEHLAVLVDNYKEVGTCVTDREPYQNGNYRIVVSHFGIQR